MPPMTNDEIQKLKALALAAQADNTWPFNVNVFRKALTPQTVLSLIAQLEARQAVEAWKYRAVGGNGEWRVTLNEQWARCLNGDIEVIPLCRIGSVAAVEAPKWGLSPISSPEYKAEQLAKNRAASARLEAVAAVEAEELAQLLNSAAENLRSADNGERRVNAAFSIAYKLDQVASKLYSALSPSPAVEAVSEQSDAGALEIACIINKKLGEVIAGRMYLLPDDLAALKRFYECATDFDSGGHDVPKAAMVRLCEIGVCRHLGFGNHTTTSFGDYVLERDEGEPAKLPLKTLVERNADAAIAAKGN